MAEQFKPGDEVQLRSGGPIMTVVKYADFGLDGGKDMKYLGRWFDDRKRLRQGTFTEPELRAIPLRSKKQRV